MNKVRKGVWYYIDFLTYFFLQKNLDLVNLGQLLGFLDDTKDRKMIPAGFKPFNDNTRYVIKRVQDLTDFKYKFLIC